MFSHQHRRPRCASVCLTAVIVMAGLLSAAPAEAARLGHKPTVHPVHYLQLKPSQQLRWSKVRGARYYQVFVKQARFNHALPREWTPLKRVRGTKTTVHVSPGRTRQFGVRAIGAARGNRYAVTTISTFGTISRPAPLDALATSGKWRTVRKGSLYRNAALQARRPGARLKLRHAKGSTTVRLVGESGRRFGKVDVYVRGSLVRRIDFAHWRHNPDKRLRIRLHSDRSGTITLVTRSRKPVRISAVGHTRHATDATKRPAAPRAHPAARSFTFEGSGWGHGVGLSQYGAKAMGDAGKSVNQILSHYYSGTQLDRVADDKLLDVNVGSHVSTLVARLRALSGGAELEVCAVQRGRCAKSATIRDKRRGAGTAGKVTVSRRKGDVFARVSAPNGDVVKLRGSQIRLRWSGTRYRDGRASVVRLGNGREYRHGEMFVKKHAKTLLNAVVRMELQSEYLRGVAEMPSSWNANALRAQAIIARTYALRNGAHRTASCDCHLYDSVLDQSYVGWSKESEGSNAYYGKRWVNAVKRTNGKVLKYKGSLAGTYYFSSSGGSTLNSQDVWSSTVPYLQSVHDKWSVNRDNPNRHWATRMSQAAMASEFGLKHIRKLTITSRFKGGAVRSIKATTRSGKSRTISGKADYMRSRFGLKSAWVESIDEHY